MRPCYKCKRFSPNTPMHEFDCFGTDRYDPSIIGGCAGNGIQYDPDVTMFYNPENDPDLGMKCDLFEPKEKGSNK